MKEIDTIKSSDSSNNHSKKSAVVSELQPNNIANMDTDDIVKLYLKEIQDWPLLNALQEIELSIKSDTGSEASLKFVEDHISKGRQLELQPQVDEGIKAERNLIKSNLRLVISVAKRYTGRGIPFIDLVQAGNIGLIRGGQRFDPNRGNKFGTYVTWWIRQAITRSIADEGNTIRRPVHLGEQIKKLHKAQNDLAQEFDGEPSVEELAQETGLAPKKIINLLKVQKDPLSLDRPLFEDENTTLGEVIKDPTATNPEEAIEQQERRQIIDEAFEAILSPIEKQILYLRYGYNGTEPSTLAKIGRDFNYTRQKIRQIEQRAQKKLKAYFKEKGISFNTI